MPSRRRVKPRERKSNSLVRHSHLVVSTPSLLIGYHIEKTAGSALMKWLHKQVNEPARLTCLFDYMTTNCFFALHSDLFPAWADAWTFERCGTDVAPNWTRSALALEFHGYSKYRFWSILGKQLPALRKKYASLGGPLITTTTIREPTAHIQSSYFMWPPYIGPKVASRSCRDTRRPRPAGISCPVAVPLPSWLPFAVGLQVGSLTLSSSHTPKARGWHNPLGCSKLESARERLASFDVVGVLECTSALLLVLSFRMGWTIDEPKLGLAIAQALRRRPHGITQGGALWRSLQAWQPSQLNATTQSALRRAAACDGHLYNDALARMRRHLAEAMSDDYRQHVAAHASANCSECARLLPVAVPPQKRCRREDSVQEG